MRRRKEKPQNGRRPGPARHHPLEWIYVGFIIFHSITRNGRPFPLCREFAPMREQESLRFFVDFFFFFFSLYRRFKMDGSGADVFFRCKFEKECWRLGGEKSRSSRRKEELTHTHQKKTWDRRHLHPNGGAGPTTTRRKKKESGSDSGSDPRSSARRSGVFIFNSLPFNLPRVKKHEEKATYKKLVSFLTVGSWREREMVRDGSRSKKPNTQVNPKGIFWPSMRNVFNRTLEFYEMIRQGERGKASICIEGQQTA